MLGLFAVTGAQAYVSEEEGRVALFIYPQKFQSFFKGQEVEVTFMELGMLAQGINPALGQKFMAGHLSYEDVARFMSYDDYVTFYPKHDDYITYLNYIKTFSKLQMAALGAWFAHKKFNINQAPFTIGNAGRVILRTLFTQLFIGLVGGVLWNRLILNEKMKRCTVKIKNLTETEIAQNRTKAAKGI